VSSGCVNGFIESAMMLFLANPKSTR